MRKTILSLVVLCVLLLGMVSAQATDLEAEAESLKEQIPESYELTEKKIAEIMPIPNRFLLWTRDGKHIMWGTYGGGHFRGVDNQGKKAWGIYHNGVFAGFYDNNTFFYGRYRNNRWMAHGLFGLRTARGRYVLFPSVHPIPIEPVPAGMVAPKGK